MLKIPKAGAGAAPPHERGHIHPTRVPRLEVEWAPASERVWSNLAAALKGPRAPRGEIKAPYFRESWVRWRMQKRALAYSVAWHIIVFTFPFPTWRESKPRPVETPRNTQIVWYSPPRDLPRLRPPGPAKKASPPGDPAKPLPQRGADAFHPRQLIISAPVRPNHPRQTLIQPEAPPEPPKMLPPLPNIVQWAEAKQPARPKLNISQRDLARLRPKTPARRLEEIPVPAAPNLEPRIGDLNIAASPALDRKPALPMLPTSAPRAGPQNTPQDAAPAPDIAPELGNGSELQRLIALSAQPAPPAPALEVPPGNLAANVTISPEGTQRGAPGGGANGTAGSGGAGGGSASPGGLGGAGGTQPGTGGGGNAGSGPPGISISGGNPNATSNIAGSGIGTAPPAGSPRPNPLPARPEPKLRLELPDRTRPDVSAAPPLERIQPGAPPEAILGTKHVYTLYVNMANLSSATGSWVLRFAELNLDPARMFERSSDGNELTGPEPLRKVDPKYPPALVSARVEGDVVLYAVIRKDGTVDSIQVLKGLEAQLDQNAMQALAKWKFRPASKNGEPVELEAVVVVPFRIAPRL